MPGCGNRKEIHDGESFANRWSHPKLEGAFSQGEMVVPEVMGVNGAMKYCEAVLSIRQSDYKSVCWCWREEGRVPKQVRGQANLVDQVHMSIESPLALAKLKPAPACGPLAPAPKPKDALPPSG